MFKQIDARTILTLETPMLPVFPDRPEPVRQKDRMLTRAEMKKEKFPRATEEEFTQIVEGADFPHASKRTSLGSWKVTLVWPESAVDRHIAERVAAAKTALRMYGA